MIMQNPDIRPVPENEPNPAAKLWLATEVKFISCVYKYLCEWLELISSGQFKKDYPEKLGLIINVPPRSGKPASSRGSHSTTTIVASVCETGLHVSPAEKNEGKPRHRVRKASFSGAVWKEESRNCGHF
jgi:hypothetical protein